MVDASDLALIHYLNECTPNSCPFCQAAHKYHQPNAIPDREWYDPNGRNF
jgi:hypothetical protein